MDALGRLVAKYKAATGDGLKTRLLDQLTDLLPDPRAFDFLLRIIEDDSRAEEVARVAAIELLGGLDFPLDADRQRVIAALIRKARGAKWPVERIYAIDVLSQFLDTVEVRALFHDFLLDRTEDDQVRKAAISSLPARPPTPETIGVCKCLLRDPVLADSARLRLKEWAAG